jgi:hypothetical protein
MDNSDAATDDSWSVFDMRLGNLALLSLAVIGIAQGFIFCSKGFDPDTSRLERIPKIAAGSTFIFFSIAYLYVKIRAHLKADGLKLIDFGLIYLVLIMIPVFDLAIVEPLYWFFLVLLPAVVARAIITWLMVYEPSKAKPQKRKKEPIY